jgi:hypothetical protein
MAFGKKRAAPKAEAPVPPEATVQDDAFAETAERLTSAELDHVRLTRIYRDGIDLEHHVLMGYLAQTNASLPDGVNLEPFLMLPGECWNGPWGDFLVKYLEVSPFGSWNVVFLPRDEQSADALDMRPHPGPIDERDVHYIDDLIGRLAGEVKAAHDEIERRCGGDSEENALHEKAYEEIRQLALSIGRRVIGQKWLDKALWRFSAHEVMQEPSSGPH